MSCQVIHVFSSWTSKEQIWVLQVAEEAECIVVGVRNADTLMAAYDVFDLKTGALTCQIEPQFHPWWHGIEHIQNSQLFLHGYDLAKPGQKKGRYVYDLFSGQLLGQSPSYVPTNVPYAPNSAYHLEYQPADQLRHSQEFLDGDETIYQKHALQSEIKYPNSLQEEHPDFGVLQQLIEKYTQHHAIKHLEYLVLENRVVVSYYIYQDSLYQLHLLVLDRSLKKVLFHQALHLTGTKRMGTGLFVCYKNQLIYTAFENQVHVLQIHP